MKHLTFDQTPSGAFAAKDKAGEVVALVDIAAKRVVRLRRLSMDEERAIDDFVADQYTFRLWNERVKPPVYKLDEVAKMMGFSRGTVERLFRDEPGVIKFGHGEKMHKRKYYSVRIPKHVYERVLQRLSR